jgi:Family of unknown function (DUF6152)
MRAKLFLLMGVLVAVTAGSQQVLGHHGGAAFDQSKTVTFTGTVTELQYANPHVLVFFDVKGPDGGAPVRWSGWLTAPNKLSRAGWTKRTLVPGDEITITGTPHKEGNHILQVRKLIAPGGKDLPLFEN